MQRNKGMAVLSYFGLLILIPVFIARNDPFVRYHINQGLVLFLVDIICGILGSIIGAIPVVGGIITLALGIVIFVLFIIGIINAVKGEMKPLPLIGGIEILK
ncbi:MAG: hypothetical protein IJE28_04735 [Oscillospiraceae bacterium]|nr:hypothetical protein [Oscillospiraceae bacterium]MBQ4642888.1 hypothetical protein [Oscillospiraceae bacterium]